GGEAPGRDGPSAPKPAPPPPPAPGNTSAPANAPPTGGVVRIAHKTPPPAPIPPGNGRAYLDKLLLAANGAKPDASAAMAAYELLTQCRRLAADPPKELPPGAPDCSGIGEADWREAARLLKFAAEMGDERAQMTYAQRMIGLAHEPTEIAQSREELMQANDNARRYLQQLSERGNVDAMWFLGESFASGEVTAADPVMAYAYKWAVGRAGGYPYTIDSELVHLEGQLSPQDLTRARTLGDQLIARCCSGRK
ncbi:MAG TPA: hypothetical protein VFJ62_16860, partial [Usitatibacter sp.]|nr:hypothetical protein [Usitatibacter sp.]